MPAKPKQIPTPFLAQLTEVEIFLISDADPSAGRKHPRDTGERLDMPSADIWLRSDNADMPPEAAYFGRLFATAAELFAERDWRGDCYEVASKLVTRMDRADLLLVHGRPLGRGGAVLGKRFGHAWAELDCLVFDLTVSPNPFIRSSYYTAGQLDGNRVKCYTPTQSRIQMVRKQHYGPWRA